MDFSPHVLGIDDGPFSKEHDHEVDIAGIMMEGSTLVEGISLNQFSVDGAKATAFLDHWVQSMRWYPSLQAVMFAGITIAGLGMVDIKELSRRLALPILSVTRSAPTDNDLRRALKSAGLSQRIDILEKTPPSRKLQDGIHITTAGTNFNQAGKLVRSTLSKARIPEPIRMAHLMATAVATGESHGNP